MPNRLKKARFVRLAVAAAALASPLAASGVAQAALGSGLASSNTAAANLVSAMPVSGVAGSLQVCYDKTITVGATGNTAFHLKGYRSANDLNSNNAQVDPTNTKCVLVRFPTTRTVSNGPSGSTQQDIDVTKYTIVSADANAVSANTGNPNANNQADSVALTVPLASQSKDGTRGVSAPGNLIGILDPTGTNQTTNSLTYLFDRPVLVTNASRFFYVNSAGNGCNAQAVINGNGTSIVTVTFGNAGTSTTNGTQTSNLPGITCVNTAGSQTTVASATRGGVQDQGFMGLHDPASTNYSQATRLGSCKDPCSTSGRPTLTKAELNPGNLDQVIFTFDQNVTTAGSYYAGRTGAGFFVELSNGQQLNGQGNAVVNGNTVTVNFNGTLAQQAEYGINAFVLSASVTPADNPTPSGFNTPASSPIGDNSGGRAPGFTTAAEIMAAQVSGGTISITVDQRVSNVNVGLINLVTNNGQIIAAGPAGANCSASFNGAQGVVFDPNANAVNPVNFGKITLTCPQSQLVNLQMVQFLAGATSTPLTLVFGAPAGTNVVPGTQGAQPSNDQINANQVDTVVRSASILKGYNAVKAHHPSKGKAKHHKHHKNHKK